MSELQQILAKLDDIAAASVSPYLRGDKAGAMFAGYTSVKAFRAWARSQGVKPSVSDGINFWSRSDIVKAREKGKI